jgi:hypothetical protein
MSTTRTYTRGHGGISFSVPRHHVHLIDHASGWDLVACADAIDLGEPWRDTSQMAENIPGNAVVAMSYKDSIVDV